LGLRACWIIKKKRRKHEKILHDFINVSDIYDVQSHLGHSSVTTTIQYYGQFGHKDWIAKTRNRLENSFLCERLRFIKQKKQIHFPKEIG